MKKYLSGIAFILAVALSAFTTKMSHYPSRFNQQWYQYTNATGDGNVNNNQNYVLISGDLGCNSSTNRCEVKAQPSGNPSFPNLGDPNIVIRNKP